MLMISQLFSFMRATGHCRYEICDMAQRHLLTGFITCGRWLLVVMVESKFGFPYNVFFGNTVRGIRTVNKRPHSKNKK